jgi:hypothetical protein
MRTLVPIPALGAPQYKDKGAFVSIHRGGGEAGRHGEIYKVFMLQ